jgi:hypothetical protein
VLRILRSAGFSIAMTAHAYAVLDSYIYGFVLQEQNLPIMTPADLEATADQILGQLPADEFPYFTEMIVEHALKAGYSFADEFEFGLDLILDGLERARGSESSRRRRPPR